MENQNNPDLNHPNKMTGPHKGMQGIDKAPGEEQNTESPENGVDFSQKGKSKVDGDPSLNKDQPISGE